MNKKNYIIQQIILIILNTLCIGFTIYLIKKCFNTFTENTLYTINSNDYFWFIMFLIFCIYLIKENISFIIESISLVKLYRKNNEKIITKLDYILAKTQDDGFDIKDSCHSMSELYFQRMVLFLILSETKEYKKYFWKSYYHEDGTKFDNYFIIGLNTPEGIYSFHFHDKYYDLFLVKELDKAPKYDGHQPEDIDRLLSLLK